MRKTVYFHIGAPKTGTTFLQGVLWRNKEALAERGLSIPGRGPLQHFRAGFDLRGLEPNPEDPRGTWIGAWHRLVREIQDCPAERVVVSDERLAACSEQEVSRLVDDLEPAEVRAIYTVRSPVSLLPASWQEDVKHGNRRAFDDWLRSLERARPDSGVWFWRVNGVRGVLDRWGTRLSPDQLFVLTLPVPGTPKDVLWSRFASVLGVEEGGLDLDVRGNSSVGMEGAELLRAVNGLLPQDFPHWHRIRFVREALAHSILATRPSKVPIRLPQESLQTVRGYADDAAAAIGDSGCKVVGDLQELWFPPDEAQPSTGTVDLRGVAEEAIAGLVVRMSKMQDSRRESERRLRAERDEARRRLADEQSKAIELLRARESQMRAKHVEHLRKVRQRSAEQQADLRARIRSKEAALRRLRAVVAEQERWQHERDQLSATEFVKRGLVELAGHSHAVDRGLRAWRHGRALGARIRKALAPSRDTTR